MKQYDVTITARVTKTLRVEADNENAASDLAYQNFNVTSDGLPEKYNEDIDYIVEVKPKRFSKKI